MSIVGRIMSTQTQATANNFGGFEVASFIPGQTVTRAHWSWHSTGAAASNTGFPPGSAVVKVGLTVDVSGLPEASMPTPVTQNTIRWMDIVTVGWIGGIAASTQTEWLWWGSTGPPDKIMKTQWRNDTAGLLGLYLTWESLFAADTDPSFTFLGTASCDTFILS